MFFFYNIRAESNKEKKPDTSDSSENSDAEDKFPEEILKMIFVLENTT